MSPIDRAEINARVYASTLKCSIAEITPRRILAYHGVWYKQVPPVAIVASITLDSEGNPIDWAAYLGHCHGESDEEVVEGVRARGSKLPPELARGLFPEIDAEYRP